MKKLRLPRISRGLTIILGLFGCFSCFLCVFYAIPFVFGENLTCWEARNLPFLVLEHDSRFNFPSSAQHVLVQTESGWSFCVTMVRFEMQAGDLNHFVATTNVGTLSAKNPLLDYHQASFKDLGWNGAAVKSSLFGYNNRDYFNQQYIYVDTTNPDTYVVYLVTDQGFLD